SGDLLGEFGARYLFLEPEFQGQISFLSFFILGIAVGGFTVAWHLVSYIVDAYRFFFIAFLEKPFIHFAVNNHIIPGFFWGYWIWQVWNFHTCDVGTKLSYCLAICLGGFLIGVISIVSFGFWNKGIFKTIQNRAFNKLRTEARMRIRSREYLGLNLTVHTYIHFPFQIRKTPPLLKGDYRELAKILNQHHANAFFFLGFLLTILLLVTGLQDVQWFQVPAAAVVVWFSAICLMLVAAIVFWFRKIGIFAILAFFLLFSLWNSNEIFVGRHPAYGLKYDVQPATYSLATIQVADSLTRVDSLQAISILEQWKIQTGKPKPKLLLTACSGGGLRAALWTYRCLAYADSITNQKFRRHLHLISGASGGMLGAAFFREQLLQQQTIPDATNRISADLLNRIMISLIGNNYLPAIRSEWERGKAFETELERNTNCFANRTLHDYQQPERFAQIPRMILSPTITNDGRRLWIASNPVRFLAKADSFNVVYQNETRGIDFLTFFQSQQSAQLKISSALRMNATFPIILPPVELPSNPPMVVMDAGLADNFGIETAVAYTKTFKDWILQETDGVILLLIRDSEQSIPIEPVPPPTALQRFFRTLSGTYQAIAETKDYTNDD
ncbi:MAG: patatin-like phospholipase family protein, partial [Bacteroidia bacterium]|nr:patatin-like phospholipase family protein [Bacteroidia bacterium]